MLRYCRPGQAVGLPHSAGRLPVKPMLPNSSWRMATKRPLLPQDAGKCPVRSVSHSPREDKDENARGSAQLGGKVPASTPCIADHSWQQPTLDSDT